MFHRPASQALLHRLAAICLALVLFLPAGLALQLSAMDTCSCGMKSGCFCKTMSPHGGAHCGMKPGERGGCGMKAPSRSDNASLPMSLDLRGWLRVRPSQLIEPGWEPSGTVIPLSCPLAPAPPQIPETPPPEPFRTA